MVTMNSFNGLPLSPYPLPVRSSRGEGAMLFAEEKVGLLPRPVRNERGEGKGRGVAHPFPKITFVARSLFIISFLSFTALSASAAPADSAARRAFGAVQPVI